jgi:hypothetical protein
MDDLDEEMDRRMRTMRALRDISKRARQPMPPDATRS